MTASGLRIPSLSLVGPNPWSGQSSGRAKAPRRSILLCASCSVSPCACLAAGNGEAIYLPCRCAMRKICAGREIASGRGPHTGRGIVTQLARKRLTGRKGARIPRVLRARRVTAAGGGRVFPSLFDIVVLWKGCAGGGACGGDPGFGWVYCWRASNRASGCWFGPWAFGLWGRTGATCPSAWVKRSAP